MERGKKCPRELSEDTGQYQRRDLNVGAQRVAS